MPPMAIGRPWIGRVNMAQKTRGYPALDHGGCTVAQAMHGDMAIAVPADIPVIFVLSQRCPS